MKAARLMTDQRLTSESEHHSGSGPTVPIRNEETELAKRLLLVIGDEPRASFARRCGLPESLVRKYLAGAMPSADRLVAIADAAGVTVDWLATGREPRLRRDLVAALQAAATGTAKATVILSEAAARHAGQAAPAWDEDRLRDAIYAVEEALRQSNRDMDPKKKAGVVRAVYELLKEEADDAQSEQTSAKIIRLIKLAA